MSVQDPSGETPPSPADLKALEGMAAILEESGLYRVLRQLDVHKASVKAPDTPTRLGLFVDVETTGLDAARHDIIELAMAPFTYGVDGRIFEIGEPFQALQQPSHPIPPEITAITGIDDAMVEGKTIDFNAVADWVKPAALVIAHNAAFDRKFLERVCEPFALKPWACSMSEVDWAGNGFEGTKLGYLAAGAGFFYQRHRAVHDCYAAIELLRTSLPKSGQLAFSQLLTRARTPTWRIWAEGAPFDLKDHLKARGYRWNGDANGKPRAWYIDVSDAHRADELAFLKTEIYQRDVELLTRRVDAHDRYSDRV